MSHFKPDESSFSKLKGAVVVIAGKSSADLTTGAATGIGAATVKILAKNGVNVFLGDVNTEAAEKLCKEHSGLQFVHCDVTKYEEIYDLFKTAFDKFGRVDHAISCAGIFEAGNWFDPDLTIDSVKQDSGNLKTLDVNVIGTLHFSRIAAVFLREGKKAEEDRSLVLLSSVNAFRESPGLYIYQTGKHAVQGTLRSSRKILFERDGIRVNAVCPGVTDTPMVPRHVIKTFKDQGLFWQPPEAVGNIIVGIEADPSIVGKAYYIEGGDGWEYEDTFYSTQPQWLGEEGCRRMWINSEAVQKGVLTAKE